MEITMQEPNNSFTNFNQKASELLKAIFERYDSPQTQSLKRWLQVNTAAHPTELFKELLQLENEAAKAGEGFTGSSLSRNLSHELNSVMQILLPLLNKALQNIADEVQHLRSQLVSVTERRNYFKEQAEKLNDKLDGANKAILDESVAYREESKKWRGEVSQLMSFRNSFAVNGDQDDQADQKRSIASVTNQTIDKSKKYLCETKKLLNPVHFGAIALLGDYLATFDGNPPLSQREKFSYKFAVTSIKQLVETTTTTRACYNRLKTSTDLATTTDEFQAQFKMVEGYVDDEPVKLLNDQHKASLKNCLKGMFDKAGYNVPELKKYFPAKGTSSTDSNSSSAFFNADSSVTPAGQNNNNAPPSEDEDKKPSADSLLALGLNNN